MTNPTYGQPIIEPDDIVERLDALILRDGFGTPIAWSMRIVSTRVLDEASAEIDRLRDRVEVLEAALKPFADKPAFPNDADDKYGNYVIRLGDIRFARDALEAKL
jgi:hypothetical protein